MHMELTEHVLKSLSASSSTRVNERDLAGVAARL